MSESHRRIERPLAACGAWLLVGSVGAAEAAGELAQLFAGRPLQLMDITLIFSGIALAIASWRCGWIALDRAGRVSVHGMNAPDMASPETA